MTEDIFPDQVPLGVPGGCSFHWELHWPSQQELPPLTVGAVFANGAFGALTSPLCNITITTASNLDMDLVDHARYKLKSSAIGAVLAAGLFNSIRVHCFYNLKSILYNLLR
jgi:hypothetical protein